MAESPGTGGAPSQVQETKEQAKGQAHEVAATVAEHAGAVTQEAKGKATAVVHDVRRELQTQGDWQPFTPARLEDELKQGHPVFVDFTAAWCLTCKDRPPCMIAAVSLRLLYLIFSRLLSWVTLLPRSSA